MNPFSCTETSDISQKKGKIIIEERQEVGGGHLQLTLERQIITRQADRHGRRLTDDTSIPTLALPRLIARKTGRTNNADDGSCCTSVKGCKRHVEIEKDGALWR